MRLLLKLSIVGSAPKAHEQVLSTSSEPETADTSDQTEHDREGKCQKDEDEQIVDHEWVLL